MQMTIGRIALRRTRASIALLAGACMASACGGGGGGSDGGVSPSAPAIISIDAQPPVVAPAPPAAKSPVPSGSGDGIAISAVRVDPVITHPAPDSTDVPAATSIVVAYARAIDRSKPVAATLSSVRGSEAGTLTVDGGNVIFMPNSPLAGATAYTFALDAHIASSDGTPPERVAMVLEFRTAASI